MRTRMSSPRGPFRALVAGLLAALGLVSVLGAPPLLSISSALNRDQTGRWTPRQPWRDLAIHLALLRGDSSPYHSKILWWTGTDDENGVFDGGLWGCVAKERIACSW